MEITSAFKAGCSALPQNATLKLDRLPFLEIINALQIFQPDMDPGSTTLCGDIFHSLDSYSSSDVCWIIDEMVSAEVAWYRGGPLSQTIFRCLFYHKPELVPPRNEALRVYVLAYCKTIELAYSRFSRGDICDGEDCWMDHCGVAMQLPENPADVSGSLHAAMQSLGRTNGWEQELSIRLAARMAVLKSVAEGRPTFYVHPDASTTSPRLSSRPSPGARAVFKEVTRTLRQTMPLVPVLLPSHEQAAVYLREMLSQWASVTDLRGSDGEPSPHSMNMPAVTQAGILLATANGLLSGSKAANTCVRRGRLTLIRELYQQYQRIPLKSRPRQRREYLSMAQSWTERLSLARSANWPGLFAVVDSLRLDCHIEAVLAGWDCELFSAEEELETWWWLNRVAGARANLPCTRSWRTTWALTWVEISSGMMQALANSPYKPDAGRFYVRHKWTLRTTRHDPIPPRYSHCLRDIHAAAAAISPMTGRAIAHYWRRARHHLADLMAQVKAIDADLTALQQLDCIVKQNSAVVARKQAAYTVQSRTKWMPLLA